MEVTFLKQFYDQLLESELKSLSDTDPMFRYLDVLVKVCKKIQEVCNNSRVALETFTSYLYEHFIFKELYIPETASNKLVLDLSKEYKHVIYFAQISFRLLLLSYFCKIGVYQKRKYWRVGLEYLIKKTRLEFMFNCHESLATMLVNLINRIYYICNELPYYERMALAFSQLDLDFFVDEILSKKKKLKYTWKSRQSTQVPLVPLSSQLPAETPKQTHGDKNNDRTKLSRKSVKIVNPPESHKVSHDETLRARISNFHESHKRRQSYNLSSARRRTIFHARKYVKKGTNNENQQEFYDSEFFLFYYYTGIEYPNLNGINTYMENIPTKCPYKEEQKGNTFENSQHIYKQYGKERQYGQYNYYRKYNKKQYDYYEVYRERGEGVFNDFGKYGGQGYIIGKGKSIHVQSCTNQYPTNNDINAFESYNCYIDYKSQKYYQCEKKYKVQKGYKNVFAKNQQINDNGVEFGPKSRRYKEYELVGLKEYYENVGNESQKYNTYTCAKMRSIRKKRQASAIKEEIKVYPRVTRNKGKKTVKYDSMKSVSLSKKSQSLKMKNQKNKRAESVDNKFDEIKTKKMKEISSIRNKNHQGQKYIEEEDDESVLVPGTPPKIHTRSQVKRGNKNGVIDLGKIIYF